MRTGLGGQLADGDDEQVKTNMTSVVLAGRITAIREHGGSIFVDINDGSGKIQAYLKEDKLGEEFKTFSELVDIGDFIEVSGLLFKTKRN